MKEKELHYLIDKSIVWWNNLPLQNLQDMEKSWVGYIWKYYPDKKGYADVTTDEIFHIWLNENVDYLRKLKIDKIKKL